MVLEEVAAAVIMEEVIVKEVRWFSVLASLVYVAYTVGLFVYDPAVFQL